MSFPSLIAELEVAVKIGTPEKRVATLRKVTNLFLGESERLNEQQIRVFDDVLMHLIQRIEHKALIRLSQNLAPVDKAPIEVMRHLSRHNEIMIAGPVLSQSKRLSESDLINVAQTKGQPHLLAIAERTSLSEGVTDVLVERGDTQVHHKVARNSGARYSERGLSSLLRKSENDEVLAESLGKRHDIPPQLHAQLLARATELVRSRLLAAATPENQELIQGALASVAKDVSREAAVPRDYKIADTLVFELNRNGKLNEAALVRFMNERKYEEMTATLALFCGVKSSLIDRLLQNVQYDGLLVACKAAKLSWPTVALVLNSRFSWQAISEQELNEARDAFLELSESAAQRSMRFMQVQQVAKKTA
jgi:uncharacterized protein (DUF2336 family)